MELLNRAKSGDQEAFGQLIASRQADLERYIRARMGPTLRGWVEPEDILQETLLRAYRSLETFRWDGESSLRGWLRCLARHATADAARAAARRRPELQIVRDPTARGVPPARRMRRQERFDRLQKTIEGLSGDYQTVIRLARLEGLPLSEVGAAMGRSESAVKNLLWRAMKELRSTFDHTDSMHFGSVVLETQGSPETLGTADMPGAPDTQGESHAA